jgi:hypothetical protein
LFKIYIYTIDGLKLAFGMFKLFGVATGIAPDIGRGVIGDFCANVDDIIAANKKLSKIVFFISN